MQNKIQKTQNIKVDWCFEMIPLWPPNLECSPTSSTGLQTPGKKRKKRKKRGGKGEYKNLYKQHTCRLSSHLGSRKVGSSSIIWAFGKVSKFLVVLLHVIDLVGAESRSTSSSAASLLDENSHIWVNQLSELMLSSDWLVSWVEALPQSMTSN